MKFNTKNPITSFTIWLHFSVVMLMITLMLPAVAVPQSFPAPVNLGTAGDFVILAKTGISTTGVTSIVGDIGVSPIDHTAITGFGLILDPSGTFSTSTLVVGKVYAADYEPPTPVKMTTAVSDMETAYTDAAGRTLPDYTELYSGDLTGQTLTHGLYKWSTGVLVSAGGVTISGSASDVFIFQIAGDLTLANGAIVTLGGDAQAYNIFWQVAGQVTLGTSSDFAGIILCQTLIAIQNGGTVNGRALAMTAVTTDANTVTIDPIVPVELKSFTSNVVDGKVLLNWQTASELNNSGFEIERKQVHSFQTSRSNEGWQIVGFVKGKGTTTELHEYSFIDEPIESGLFIYRLKQVDYNGKYEYSNEVDVNFVFSNDYKLSQNYPNPFNPISTIQYSIPKMGFVKISIYDPLGEEIKVLVNEEKIPGNYEIVFDAKELASGIYFYKIRTGEFSQIKKMILMK